MSVTPPMSKRDRRSLEQLAFAVIIYLCEKHGLALHEVSYAGREKLLFDKDAGYVGALPRPISSLYVKLCDDKHGDVLRISTHIVPPSKTHSFITSRKNVAFHCDIHINAAELRVMDDAGDLSVASLEALYEPCFQHIIKTGTAPESAGLYYEDVMVVDVPGTENCNGYPDGYAKIPVGMLYDRKRRQMPVSLKVERGPRGFPTGRIVVQSMRRNKHKGHWEPRDAATKEVLMTGEPEAVARFVEIDLEGGAPALEGIRAWFANAAACATKRQQYYEARGRNCVRR